MRILRKTVSCFLACVMVFSLSVVPAFAQDAPGGTSTSAATTSGTSTSSVASTSASVTSAVTSNSNSSTTSSTSTSVSTDTSTATSPVTSGTSAASVTTPSATAASSTVLDASALLSFLYVDSSELAVGDSQAVVVGFMGDATVTSATLHYQRLGGSTYSVQASNLVNNTALFDLGEFDASKTGIYVLIGVDGVTRAGQTGTYSCTFDQEMQENFAFCALAASYSTSALGVQAAKSSDTTDGIIVYSLDAAGNVTSSDSVESALTQKGALAGTTLLGTQSSDSLTSLSTTPVVVAIDPGHGGNDSGASSNEGVTEASLNWKIANYCKAELETYDNVSVILTRSETELPTLPTRVARAFNAGASLFVSIHLNSSGSSGTTASGSEVWVPNDSSYNYTTHTVGTALGQRILAQLTALGLSDRGVKTRDATDTDDKVDAVTYSDGSTADYYTVINAARLVNLPSIIVEHCFINNPLDYATYLSDDTKLKSLGVADATGIAQYLRLVRVSSDLTIPTGSQTVSNGIYSLVSGVNGTSVVDVTNASSDDGANVQLYSSNGCNNQKFVFTYNGNGTYTITALHSDKALCLEMPTDDLGENVVQCGTGGTDGDDWIVQKCDGGGYRIISALTGMALDVAWGASTDGTNIRTWTPNGCASQTFDLVSLSVLGSSTQTVADGTYSIVSGVNGTSVVDIQYASQNEGAAAWLYQPLGTANQRFTITYGDNGYYTIRSANSGKYLCVQDDSLQNGASVCQTEDGEGIGSQWIISSSGSGYSIVSALSGRALDVAWGNSADGTAIRVWTPNGCPSQTFTFASDVVVASLGETLHEGTYTLSTMLNTTSVLDVAWASSAEGGNIWLYTANNCANQNFMFDYGDDGYYTIQSVSSGKYVCVQDFNNSAGANVCQTSDGSGLNAKWVLKKLSDGSYEVISALTGCVLDVDHSKTTDGTNVGVWYSYGGAAQHFYVGGTQAIKDGYYSINSSVADDTVLDIADSSVEPGGNLQLSSYNGAGNQRFVMKYQGRGYYTIECVSSGLYLTVAGNGSNGSNVDQESFTGGENQQWMLFKQSDGTYSVRSHLSGMALDVANGSSADGTNIRVWEPNGLSSQSFSFTIPSLVSAGVYVIAATTGDNLALNVAGSSTADGGNIEIASRPDDQVATQRFAVSPNGDGTYAIKSVYSGKYLDVAWSGQADGTNVQQWTANGYDCQKWIIVACNGGYSLISACNLKALDVEWGAAESGTNVQIWTINNLASQTFTFDTPQVVLPNGYFSLASAIDQNYVLDIANASTDDGANLQLYSHNGGDNQVFYLAYDAVTKSYTIRPAHSNKALDVAWSGQSDGTNVWQWAFNGYACQRWQIIANADGTYTFISKANGKALDVTWGMAANGTNVQTWSPNGLASQKFVLSAATPLRTYEELSFSLDQMVTWQKISTYLDGYTDEQVKTALDPDVILASTPLQFADLRQSSNLTGAQLDSYILSNAKGQSGVFNGHGATFVAAAKLYGINEVYFLTHSIWESGWGTSTLAKGVYYDGKGFTAYSKVEGKDVYTVVDSTGTLYPAGTYYNFFGIGAYDTDPTVGGFTRAIQQGWNSVDASIYGAAKWIAANYTYRSDYAQYTLYLMKWDYNRSEDTNTMGWHQYCTGTTWAAGIASLMQDCYDNAGVTPYLKYVIPDYS